MSTPDNDPILVALRALPRLTLADAKAARLRARAHAALARHAPGKARDLAETFAPAQAFFAGRVMPVTLAAGVLAYLVWAAQAANLL